MMEQQIFKDVERFSNEKHVHVQLFNGERTKVLLLCLAAGISVPPHSHPGFEITLQPLKGKAVLPTGDGKEITLEPGKIFFADGAFSFNPQNPFQEEFEMLIHLVKR